MSVNGIGIGYPAWGEVGKAQKNSSGTGFANKMVSADTVGSVPSQRANVRAAGQNTVLEAYWVLASKGVRNVKPAYNTYESEDYKIVPDNEAGCFDIYNKQGERLGAFAYSDIKIRQDSATGKQLLISEHGTMSYDALVMDGEMKEALQDVMGVEKLETEEMQGFTLKTHSGTGLQYLVRDGEEGRGGKVLLQSQADIEKYEALAETYFNRYPNLVHDKNAAYIWADLEIKGLAQHTKDGIVTVTLDGINYMDENDASKSWAILCSMNDMDMYSDIMNAIHENTVEGGIENVSGWEEWFKEKGYDHENVPLYEESGQIADQESKTQTDIIVKPDGSRVLVVTMSIGGMETTMSLEISKPTEAPNENSEHDTDNNMSSGNAEMDAVSDEMSNISTEA